MRINEVVSQQISELRRNPEQNNQRIGLQTVLTYLKKLPADQLVRTYVSGQDVNKLGINYKKPVRGMGDIHLPGIYAWPAKYFLRTKGRPIDPDMDVGRDRHYKFVFEVDPKYVMTKIRQVDSMIKSIIDTESELGKKKVAYALNKKLRDAGIGAITVGDDPGNFLAIDEYSTVVLATKYISNVRAFVDRPEHIPSDGDLPDEKEEYKNAWDNLSKLAARQPLTNQQELALINQEKVGEYLEFLVSHNRKPTSKKMVNAITSYAKQAVPWYIHKTQPDGLFRPSASDIRQVNAILAYYNVDSLEKVKPLVGL